MAIYCEIKLFVINLEDISIYKEKFNTDFIDKIQGVAGNIKKVVVTNLINKESNVFTLSNYNFANISDNFEYEFHHENGSNSSLYYNRKDKRLVIQVNIAKRNDILSNLKHLSKYFGENFNLCSFSITFPKVEDNIYRELKKINREEYDSLNYHYAGHTSWINIYPEKTKRLTDKILLPVGDEFYLNIPAYKVEKLMNGSILVELNENPENVEETLEANVKVIEYYKKRLIEFGIWKKVKWWTDWKEKYRDVLKEHGFEI